MDASELGESIGTIEGNIDILSWDKPKINRKITFWITFVICLISTIVFMFTGDISIGTRVLILIGGGIISFCIAWVCGWISEYRTAARQARLIQYCNTTPKYVECKRNKTKKECLHIPEMKQCIREQQRIEDQNNKLDQLDRKLDRLNTYQHRRRRR